MWSIIKDFPDYQVSDCGQVRSFRVRHDTTQETQNPGTIMTGFKDSRGYHSVILRKPNDSKPYRRSVRRLVATAFIPNPYSLSDVANNDGNASNNHKDNLRWATHRDNQMDMRKHGTIQDGEKSITCKITAEVAREIRTKAADMGRGAGVRLAKEYNLSTAQVSRIINGVRWAHL